MGIYYIDGRRQSPPRRIEVSWRGILDVLPAASHVCDADGLITYFNRIAETVWGRPAALRNATQRFCAAHRLYSPTGTPLRHDQCWIARALQEGIGYEDRELVIERCDGSRTWGRAYAHPLRDKQDRVIGAVNLIADITASRQPADPRPPGSLPVIPHTATVAMIDIAVSVLAGMRWPPATFD